MDDDDVSLLIARRARKAKAKRKATVMTIGLVGGLLAVVVGVAVVVSRTGRSGRATTAVTGEPASSIFGGDQTEGMTYLELLDRMKRNGMKNVSMAPAGSFQVFVDDPSRAATQTADLMERGRFRYRIPPSCTATQTKSPLVKVQNATRKGVSDGARSFFTATISALSDLGEL